MHKCRTSPAGESRAGGPVADRRQGLIRSVVGPGGSHRQASYRLAHFRPPPTPAEARATPDQPAEEAAGEEADAEEAEAEEEEADGRHHRHRRHRHHRHHRHRHHRHRAMEEVEVEVEVEEDVEGSAAQ